MLKHVSDFIIIPKKFVVVFVTVARRFFLRAQLGRRVKLHAWKIGSVEINVSSPGRPAIIKAY